MLALGKLRVLQEPQISRYFDCVFRHSALYYPNNSPVLSCSQQRFLKFLPHSALGTCWRSLLPAVYQFMDFHPSVTVRVGDGQCLEVGSLCLDENQSLFSFLILSSDLHSAHSAELLELESLGDPNQGSV